VGRLADAIQEATGESVALAYVDQGYTGEKPAQAARERGTALALASLLKSLKTILYHRPQPEHDADNSNEGAAYYLAIAFETSQLHALYSYRRINA
jgi:hypothetical protein